MGGGELPKGWGWSGTCLGRQVGTKRLPGVQPAPAASPDSNGAEAVIGGPGPSPHPFSLTSQAAEKEGWG